MLELRRFGVSEAADGAQAVEAARRERPDLVLMDLQMPVMDGLEAARRLRDFRECEGIVLIAYTTFDTQGMREAAIGAGFDDYLVKPFGFEELDGVLRRHPLKG